MLYQKPGMEILKIKETDVIRTSDYHDPDNPGDSTDTSNKWP